MREIGNSDLLYSHSIAWRIMEILTINPKELTEQEKDEMLDIDSSCSDPSLYINFLAKDNEIVGYATLKQDEDRWNLINLAVRHDCRRRGLGEKLISETLRYISKIEIGTSTIYLMCPEDNIIAQTVFKRSNFEVQTNGRTGYVYMQRRC
jgi:ribosomal protein S18 acetylase RimI-like enzyme